MIKVIFKRIRLLLFNKRLSLHFRFLPFNCFFLLVEKLIFNFLLIVLKVILFLVLYSIFFYFSDCFLISDYQTLFTLNLIFFPFLLLLVPKTICHFYILFAKCEVNLLMILFHLLFSIILITF